MTSAAPVLAARTAAEWRDWLAKHCQSETQVWLAIPHRSSAIPGVRYDEAVEQALCFGWIDSLHRKCGADSSQLRFTPRRPRSNWSPANCERAARLIALGLMTEHGHAAIDHAVAAGTWTLFGTRQAPAMSKTPHPGNPMAAGTW